MAIGYQYPKTLFDIMFTIKHHNKSIGKYILDLVNRE